MATICCFQVEVIGGDTRKKIRLKTEDICSGVVVNFVLFAASPILSVPSELFLCARLSEIIDAVENMLQDSCVARILPSRSPMRARGHYSNRIRSLGVMPIEDRS